MIRIYDTDAPEIIARKIYYDFDVMASCSVFGFVRIGDELVAKGELVWKEIDKLDTLDNVYVGKDGKRVRRTTYKKNSIGGSIAQKIFTFEKRIVDNEPRYTIWRYQ